MKLQNNVHTLGTKQKQNTELKNYAYVRVNSCMNPDHNSHQINQRERINGILNRREISGGRISIDGECVRSHELVLCSFEEGVV